MAQFIRYKNYFGDGTDLIDWNIEEFCGYKPITTYYSDFSIADRFGKSAVVDTYSRAVENWGQDIKWMTEIVMVLNWKIFEHYEKDKKMAELYNDLWEKAQNHVFKTFTDEEDLSYYYRTTD